MNSLQVYTLIHASSSVNLHKNINNIFIPKKLNALENNLEITKIIYKTLSKSRWIFMVCAQKTDVHHLIIYYFYLGAHPLVRHLSTVKRWKLRRKVNPVSDVPHMVHAATLHNHYWLLMIPRLTISLETVALFFIREKA